MLEDILSLVVFCCSRQRLGGGGGGTGGTFLATPVQYNTDICRDIVSVIISTSSLPVISVMLIICACLAKSVGLSVCRSRLADTEAFFWC